MPIDVCLSPPPTAPKSGSPIAHTIEVLAWAGATFGDRLCLLASMQDAVLIDLVSRVIPDTEIVFLDTGYHFAETHETLRNVEERYGIRVTVVGPIVAPRDQIEAGQIEAGQIEAGQIEAGQIEAGQIEAGECCATKPQLLDIALVDRRAWLTGARRIETPERANLDVVGTDRRGLTKVSPLAYWSDLDVEHHIRDRRVPTNPLIGQGFLSIGCEPCTTKADSGNPRSGRWRGTDRTECGLHL